MDSTDSPNKWILLSGFHGLQRIYSKTFAEDSSSDTFSSIFGRWSRESLKLSLAEVVSFVSLVWRLVSTCIFDRHNSQKVEQLKKSKAW